MRCLGGGRPCSSCLTSISQLDLAPSRAKLAPKTQLDLAPSRAVSLSRDLAFEMAQRAQTAVCSAHRKSADEARPCETPVSTT
mmetsp:Transcript_17112/g.39215  ORF Transcript_17112/g.39215 Transcript_17112/m.39215 type:complete len:83 (-) Transcript_17112:451-699(-)